MNGFVTTPDCVYSAVRAELLNIIKVKLRLNVSVEYAFCHHLVPHTIDLTLIFHKIFIFLAFCSLDINYSLFNLFVLFSSFSTFGVWL